MSDPIPDEKTPEPGEAETPLDLHFFRPAGHLVVLMALPTPLDATGMGVISVLVGLAGASAFRFVSRTNLVIGAALMLLSAILGRASLELGHARGTPSRLRRVGDHVVGVAFGLAMAIHLYTLQGGGGAWLAVGGMGSALLHEALADHFKGRCITRAREAGAPAEGLALIVQGWSYLGRSTHIALLCLAACAGELGLYAWLRLTLGNMLVAALYVEQRRRESELA